MTENWFRLAQKILAALIVFLISATLLYGSCYRMQLNGLRAEMRLMLSYIHTLQKSYEVDEGRFSYFEEYYGAQISGKDHCEQPEGAARLGFILHWCHEEQATELRYAYQVIPTVVEDESSFLAVAHSGSDVKDRSFICYFSDQIDVWTIDEKKRLQSLRSCD
ncbi:MAG: hypothetical protein ACOH5I_11645 [Oligoflexus sp.]